MGLLESPQRLFLGIRLSEPETETCFLKMEWQLAGEADPTVGSMVMPMSLQSKDLLPSLYIHLHVSTPWEERHLKCHS